MSVTDKPTEPKDELLNQPSPSKDAGERFMQRHAVFITNDKLCCARCVHVWENKTAECAIYEQKPTSVLRGGECPDLELP